MLRLEHLGFNILISSVPASGGGSAQVEIVQRQGVCDSSTVALQAVVSPPSKEVGIQVSPPRGSLPLPVDPQGPSRSGENFTLQASRLGVMRDALSGEGFSNKAIDIILGCHKPSTIKQYQSAWNKFLDYMSKEGRTRHGKIKLHHVLNFLAFEVETHERAYRTIANYKCALDLPLKIALNLDLSEGKNGEKTKRFMQGCYNQIPIQKRPMPEWDLSDLLLFLRSDRFEDLHTVSFSLLTLKVLALLLIATGRRISEIANL